MRKVAPRSCALDDHWRRSPKCNGPFLTLVLCLCLLFAVPAGAAETRLALVVGNAGYARVAPLTNPANDAEDVASALSAAGFQVDLGIDLDKSAFDRKVRQFAQKLNNSDVALFFYAGHGLQAKGINYLVPTDAKIQAEQDLDLETVNLDTLLKQMGRSKVKIVFLDACRNNPFAKNLSASMGSRAVGENLGLAITTSSLNTFIAFSTQPGAVANDGSGRNSPFTGSLKTHIPNQGVSIADLMIAVRNEVVTATQFTQVPWEHSALLGKFYFKPGSAPEPDKVARERSDAAVAWGWIKNTTDLSLLEEFLSRYPQTPFAEAARERISQVKQQQSQETDQVLPRGNLKTISLAPLRPSFDCKVRFADAEVAVCNNPELAMLDNEMARLYSRTVQALGAQQSQRQAFLGAQREWLETRNACGADVACLKRQYQVRIRQMQNGSQGSSAITGKVKPSFDCQTHFLPAEVAICGDPNLARLDVELGRQYDRALNVSPSRTQALAAEQRQWLSARDTCARDATCLKIQYQARLQQLQAWR